MLLPFYFIFSSTEINIFYKRNKFEKTWIILLPKMHYFQKTCHIKHISGHKPNKHDIILSWWNKTFKIDVLLLLFILSFLSFKAITVAKFLGPFCRLGVGPMLVMGKLDGKPFRIENGAPVFFLRLKIL